MSASRLQVVKLGGSLLDFEQLEAQWWRWLRQNRYRQTIVVVGGGAAVEDLRASQTARRLTETDAHWAAIAEMGNNARRVAARLLPSNSDGLVTSGREQLDRALRTLPLVFVDPFELLREDDARGVGNPLPGSWDVTSDSIAARIAALLDCPNLTLLKSALPGSATTYSMAAAAGYVDRYFPTAAVSFEQVPCVNLRSERMESQTLARD